MDLARPTVAISLSRRGHFRRICRHSERVCATAQSHAFVCRIGCLLGGFNREVEELGALQSPILPLGW